MKTKNKIFAAIWLGIILMSLIQPVSAESDFAYLTETSTSFLPERIHAGDSVSLAVDITNRGNVIDIVDLQASLGLNNQFEAIDLSDSVELIKPKVTQSIILKFKVKEDTLPGYYPVFLTLEYLREGKTVTETKSISVPISSTEKNIEVTLEPKVINPGKQTELSFTLNNIGETPISNLALSWSESNDLVLPLGSDNKRYVDFLKENSSVRVSYVVAADPNIAPGIYPLDVVLTFNDVNGSRTQESQVGVIIGGTTDFEVSAEMTSGGQISLSIANIGSNNAEAVVVKILEPKNLVAGSAIEILGGLDKGDFTLANFETNQTHLTTGGETRTAPVGIRLPGMGRMTGGNGGADQTEDMHTRPSFNAGEIIIEINYTDTTGERQAVQKTIELSSEAGMAAMTATRTAAGTFSFIPLAVLGLILAGAIAFNKFKAKRNWKKLAVFLAAIVVAYLALSFLLPGFLLIGLIVFSGLSLWWFFFKIKK